MGGHRRFLRAVRRHVRVGWRGGRSARKLTCHTSAPAQQDHSKQLRAGRAAGLLPHARSYCDGLCARGSVPMEPAAQRAEVPPPATCLPIACHRLSPIACRRLSPTVCRRPPPPPSRSVGAAAGFHHMLSPSRVRARAPSGDV